MEDGSKEPCGFIVDDIRRAWMIRRGESTPYDHHIICLTTQEFCLRFGHYSRENIHRVQHNTQHATSKMPSGSCLCGGVRITYSGSPSLTTLCHCNGCKRNSGSTYSTNIIVPADSLRVTQGGSMLKTFMKMQTATGNIGVNYFCSNCGTTMWMDTNSIPGARIVKAGVMDNDAVESAKPSVEFFATGRVGWVPPVGGASQCRTMQ